MKFLKYTREILITGLVLVVVLMFVKPCGKEKDLAAYRLLQDKARSLEQKVKADSIARAEERQQFARDKQETEGRRQLAEVEKQEADNKVKQQQKTIDRLVARITNQPEKPDSSKMVLVTTDFKDACEELPAEVAKLNLALADKDSSINGILDLYAYEIQIRDEEIYKEMNYSDSLMASHREQRALFNAAMKQGKPRGRLLGGISVLGNQTNILSGAGVVLAYQTKGGKQYQVGPKFIKTPGQSSAELYYEGTVLFTIFK